MNEVRVGLVIPAAGLGQRLGYDVPKAFISIGEKYILHHTLERFKGLRQIQECVVAVPKPWLGKARQYFSQQSFPFTLTFVVGGKERSESVEKAFNHLTDVDLVAVHDAARPFVSADLVERSFSLAYKKGACILAVPASDTIKQAHHKQIQKTLERTALWLAQTPQVFRKKLYQKALSAQKKSGSMFTDDASLIEQLQHPVHIVESTPENFKITFPSDLKRARMLVSSTSSKKVQSVPKIGFGYDVHQLVSERPLVLGGVQIPFEKGLLGHSDADALCHATCDALLGAAGLGDIGTHFPDTDPAYKGANSLDLLEKVGLLLKERNLRIGNIDATIVAQRPKMKPFIPKMIYAMAQRLQIEEGSISIKATTNEKMGFVGREEGMAVHAVALIF